MVEAFMVETCMVETCVVQSCPDPCPSWMQACMGTVRDWAARSGYRYRHVPDADFLAAVPAWFQDKAGRIIQPVTDLARVEAGIGCLSTGAAAAVWVDADVLVFDPHRFALPACEQAALTREIWFDRTGPAPTPSCVERVNNSVLVAKDLQFLRRYRAACLRIARRCDGPLGKAAVGTRYLTALHRRRPLPLVRHVGNLSPHVTRAVLRAERPILDGYRAALGEPLFAANLCASYENVDYFGTSLRTADYERLVDMLLDSAGAALSP
jgi:hypothetical protein